MIEQGVFVEEGCLVLQRPALSTAAGREKIFHRPVRSKDEN
jgi:hypothetical protein